MSARKELIMSKAIGYIRVSTQKQADEGVSLDAQRAKIEAWCLANDYELAGIHCDEGISGTKSDRDGVLAAMAEAGKGTALIVYSLSRLTRSTKDLISFGDKLEKQGADLISLTEKIDTTTAAGKMVFRMLGVLNEFERDQVSERTKAALAHKKETNQVYNHTPYGYTRNGESLVKNDDEAAVAAQSVKLYHSGQTMRAIARHLNDLGIPTKLGKLWQPMQISRLIKSAA
jgi:site-specific DNA recombinase